MASAKIGANDVRVLSYFVRYSVTNFLAIVQDHHAVGEAPELIDLLAQMAVRDCAKAATSID